MQLFKSALNSFIKIIGKNYGDKIKTLSPGNIFFKGGVWDKKLKIEKSVKLYKKNVPQQRLGTPEDIECGIFKFTQCKFYQQVKFIDGGQVNTLN